MSIGHSSIPDKSFDTCLIFLQLIVNEEFLDKESVTHSLTYLHTEVGDIYYFKNILGVYKSYMIGRHHYSIFDSRRSLGLNSKSLDPSPKKVGI